MKDLEYCLIGVIKILVWWWIGVSILGMKKITHIPSVELQNPLRINLGGSFWRCEGSVYWVWSTHISIIFQWIIGLPQPFMFVLALWIYLYQVVQDFITYLLRYLNFKCHNKFKTQLKHYGQLVTFLKNIYYYLLEVILNNTFVYMSNSERETLINTTNNNI